MLNDDIMRFLEVEIQNQDKTNIDQKESNSDIDELQDHEDALQREIEE